VGVTSSDILLIFETQVEFGAARRTDNFGFINGPVPKRLDGAVWTMEVGLGKVLLMIRGG